MPSRPSGPAQRVIDLKPGAGCIVHRNPRGLVITAMRHVPGARYSVQELDEGFRVVRQGEPKAEAHRCGNCKQLIELSENQKYRKTSQRAFFCSIGCFRRYKSRKRVYDCKNESDAAAKRRAREQLKDSYLRKFARGRQLSEEELQLARLQILVKRLKREAKK